MQRVTLIWGNTGTGCIAVCPEFNGGHGDSASRHATPLLASLGSGRPGKEKAFYVVAVWILPSWLNRARFACRCPALQGVM